LDIPFVFMRVTDGKKLHREAAAAHMPLAYVEALCIKAIC
jgi:hypothetical protein